MIFPSAPVVTFAVGRVNASGLTLLGSSFVVAKGKLATTMHVTTGDERDLVIVVPRIQSMLDYQDTTNALASFAQVKIAAADPIRDICILSIASDMAPQYDIGGTDDVSPGTSIVTFGFPHANAGRLVLTQQETSVGARILIDNNGIKTKQVALNMQAQPGQSGSPVFSLPNPKVVAMVVGSYAPGGGGFISIGGIDPATLHQTTHAISSEYIREML